MSMSATLTARCRAAAARLLIAGFLLASAACALQPMSPLGSAGQFEPDASEAPGVVLTAVIDAAALRTVGSRLVDRITGREPEIAALVRPYGVAWQRDELLVTDPSSGRVARIDERGRITFSPRGAFETPIGIAACDDGIVVTDSQRGDVTLLDDDLRPRATLATGLERPTGVICRGNRPLIVETGRHRVIGLSLVASEASLSGEAAEPLFVWGRRGEGRGEFNFPTVVALGGDTVWVGDTLNFRVQALDSATGDFRSAFGRLGDAPGEMPRIKGLCVDSAGRLWVSDAALDRVALYASDGTFLASVGSPGSTPGQFSFPAGVAAHPDGRVAVADSLNRRIQVFRVHGGGAVAAFGGQP